MFFVNKTNKLAKELVDTVSDLSSRESKESLTKANELLSMIVSSPDEEVNSESLIPCIKKLYAANKENKDHLNTIKCLKFIMGKDNQSESILTEIGNQYLALKKMDYAIVYLNKALTINPNFTEALNILSFINYENNNLEGCITLLKRSVENNPDPDKIEELAQCYIKTKQEDQASEMFENILKNHPSHEGFDKAMSFLKAYYAKKGINNRLREINDMEYKSKRKERLVFETESNLMVQSVEEKLIADFLSKNNIGFDYDEEIMLSEESYARPSFYLKEHEIIIDFSDKESKSKYKESGNKYLIIPRDIVEEELRVNLWKLGLEIRSDEEKRHILELKAQKELVKKEKEELENDRELLMKNLEKLEKDQKDIKDQKDDYAQEKESINSEKQEIEKQKQDISQKEDLLNIQIDELKNKEEGLKKEREDITLLKTNLEKKEQDLAQEKNTTFLKQEEIDKKQKEIEQREQELNDKELDIGSRSEEIERRKQEFESQNQELHSDIESFEVKKKLGEEGIEQNKKDFEEKQTILKDELESKKELLKQEQETLDEQKRELTKQKDNLLTQENDLRKREEDIDNQKKIQLDKTFDLDQREDNLKKKQEELEKEKNRLEGIQQEINKKELEITEKNLGIGKEKNELIKEWEELKRKQEDLTKNQDIMRKELIYRQEEIRKENEILIKNKDGFEKAKNDIDQKKKALEAQQEDISDKQEEIRKQKQELENLRKEQESVKKELTQKEIETIKGIIEFESQKMPQIDPLLKRVQDLMIGAEDYLNQGNWDHAVKAYTKAANVYVDLPYNQKKEVYSLIRSTFDKFKEGRETIINKS